MSSLTSPSGPLTDTFHFPSSSSHSVPHIECSNLMYRVKLYSSTIPLKYFQISLPEE